MTARPGPFNLITDIAYRFVDPRIRIEGGAR